MCSSDLLMKVLGKNPEGIRAAIQGFGNVGSYTAKTLAEAGVKVVAISDITGSYYYPKGIDLKKAFEMVSSHPKRLLEG